MYSPVARHCWSLFEMSPGAAEQLLAHVRALRRCGEAGKPKPLRGRHVAALSETKDSASAKLFTEAAEALGASVVCLAPGDAGLTDAREACETARTLGRLYADLQCDGFSRARVAQLARWSGVPVFDALADELHGTRLLADVLTIADNADKPLAQNIICVEGDPADPLPVAWKKMATLVGLRIHPCAGEGDGSGPRHNGDFLSAMPPGAAMAPAELWAVDPISGMLKSLHSQQAENHRFVVQALLASVAARG